MKKPLRAQLSLFEDPASPVEVPPARAPDVPQPAPVPEHLQRVAEKLPPTIMLGTSSWAFPGWEGIVYGHSHSEKALSRQGLAAYAAHPLLRTVGLDRSYYAPVPASDLKTYAQQLPTGFKMVIKVWDEITLPVHPTHPRYGARGGQENAHFLDVETLNTFLGPFAREFADHAGPMVLEFSPMRPQAYGSREQFYNRLDDFLGKLPRAFTFAVEVRNPELLTEEYAGILRKHGVGHVFNRWTRMPPIGQQRRKIGADFGAFTVARIMLPKGATYEERAVQCAPFGALVDRDDEMRADVLDLAREALLKGAPLYVIVNNKAEGSAPLTCFALAEAIAELLG